MRITAISLVQVALLALGFALLPALTGCVAIVATGAGAGTVAYVRGDLETELDGSLDQSLKAVNKAIGELKFTKVSEQSDALLAKVVCRNSQDNRVTFHLKKISDRSTRLSIRVGTFGDQSLSQKILNAVQKSL